MTASAEILDELRKSTLAIEAQACLAAISEAEAEAFRSLYDGTLWTGSMASFPDWPGATGPTGKPTHAAGAFQDQPATYRDIAAKTGDSSFEPASQVANNWFLAKNDFKARTGDDLLTTLKAGALDKVASGLVGTWSGGANAGFAARYNHQPRGTWHDPRPIASAGEFSAIRCRHRSLALGCAGRFYRHQGGGDRSGDPQMHAGHDFC